MLVNLSWWLHTYCKHIIVSYSDIIMDRLYAANLPPEQRRAEERERRVFCDFLSYFLHPDPEQRIAASCLLQHPFITVSEAKWLDCLYHSHSSSNANLLIRRDPIHRLTLFIFPHNLHRRFTISIHSPLLWIVEIFIPRDVPNLRPHTVQPSPAYPHPTTARVALPPAAYSIPFEGSAVSEQIARTTSMNSTSSSAHTQQSAINRTAYRREGISSCRPKVTYISIINNRTQQRQRNH